MTDLRYVVTPITHVEVRAPEASGNNTYTMQGYAAVTDTRTTLYDGKLVKITEDIAPDAFDGVMRDQPMGEPGGVVHFNLGHDMNRAVAATDVPAGQPGSLSLRIDSKGLYFIAKVARDDPDGVALAAKMRTGVIKQASFAFTIASMETIEIQNDDGPDEYRDRITSIKHLYDVCACAQGAYSQTVSGLRSYAASLGLSPQGEARVVIPDPGGDIPAVSHSEGRVDIRPPALAARVAAVPVLRKGNRDVRHPNDSHV